MIVHVANAQFAQQIGTGGPSHFDHRGGGNLPPPSAAPPQQSGYIHPSRMGIVQHSGGTGGQAGSGNYGSGGSGGYTSGFGGGYASSSSGSNSYNSNNRQSRRLYIGGIVPGTPDVLIVDFLNREMNQRGMTSSPGNPVLAIQMTPDKNFAFLDMRTSEEATMCIALDGIPFEGTVFRIKRPKEYEGREANDPPSLFGMPSSSGGGFSSQGGAQGGSFGGSMGNDNPNKIYIGGLPFSLDEQQIRELLQTFGVIRNFSLVREGNGQSKGQQPPPSMPYGAPSSFGAAPITPMQATPVVQLLNMVTPEELMDPEEYQDIVDDIREECSKYGEVVSVAIPRPVPGREVSGVGKVYVEFSNVDHAYQALQALSGRKFASRIVVTSFYGLDAYRRSEF
ncbi:splicing factor u2af large subunit [Capsaspora owczarzaki ATCC 30864]|uniref:splicing factor u2af large subunit n=1 Tax=Capsaspora owczarzaki (strain ATCC 30864) TaxID=595528 RepID=UPI0001FE40F4|nr:splicing factor u2af large subunit [Capsaspora owczarzaki ATCC 30864]|eukprot:XP_004346153.1 splicing factor u2af large subunit [Capsaspora owczarzaki ATCC 30864]